MNLVKSICACGCGSIIIHKPLFSSQERLRGSARYVRGHQNRGRKHTAEHISKTSHSLEKNGRWKGGTRITKDGYKEIKCPSHPNAKKNGYVLEHRMIASNAIGRPLLKSEIIHHIDKDRKNNTLYNLEITNASNHIINHRKGNNFPRSNRSIFKCERCSITFYRSAYWKNKVVRWCSWKCRYPKT